MSRAWLILDLDNTLYPSQCGLLRAIDERISSFVSERLNVSLAEGDRIRRNFYEKYGTTIAGLMREHGIPHEDFYASIHDIDILEYIGPDPGLRRLLFGIEMPKAIFTNSPGHYARRVVETLDLAGIFEGIYGIEFSEFHSKPQPFGFRKLERELSLDRTGAVMVDDQPRNLATAAELGWKTIRYNEDFLYASDPRFTEIGVLADLPRAIAGVLDG